MRQPARFYILAYFEDASYTLAYDGDDVLLTITANENQICSKRT